METKTETDLDRPGRTASLADPVPEVERHALALRRVEEEIRRVIVGQDYLIDRLLAGLLARGHVLIEGVPGLAKTLAVKTLARTLAIGFQRIQFTPDLLPADLVGTLVYDQESRRFHPRPSCPISRRARQRTSRQRFGSSSSVTGRARPAPRATATSTRSGSHWRTSTPSANGETRREKDCRSIQPVC